MRMYSSRPAALSGEGIIWIRLAVVYLVVGVAMGIGMGASHDFTLRPVHAHVNLLGWTTLALAGLIYTVFPAAGRSVLARIHFWLLNISIPIMMAALSYILLTGDTQVGLLLGIAQVMAAGAILAFAANLFVNLRVVEAEEEMTIEERARYA